jgi:uncharacterized damage-inducible protein DinB
LFRGIDKMKKLIVGLALALPMPLVAQSGAPSAVAAARANWTGVTRNLTRAAEQLPESLYAFKPVESVRTFGQQIAHVAGSQNMYCAIALGDPPRGEDDIEKTKTSKADLVAALKASTTYCERAYAQTDAAAQAMVNLFGQNVTKLHTLMGNALHNGEHYGNIVTYLRMKGLVPPSSQRGG